MKKHIISFILAVAAIILTMSLTAYAEERTEVYTQFTQGNFSNSGEGTAASPYNLFEDAFNAVADGGTIYLSGNAFINDTNDLKPFALTKNVTVSALPNAAYRPTLSVWTSGMVLGGNVTFNNVILDFSNGIRPILCANGYTLTLNNVSYDKSARKIHIAGGGMHDSNGISLSPAEGPHGRIIVKGKNSSFGNIYAGGINGSFDKSADISVADVSGQNIGNIYSCGAKEGYYNVENLFDKNNEPDDPYPQSDNYPVGGSVKIDLCNTGLNAVYGTTGNNTETSLSISTQYLHSCSLSDISNLEIKQGTFAPDAMNNDINIVMYENGILDLSTLGNCEVNDFNGNGILMLNEASCLTINGKCTGTTELRTTGGLISTSGLAQYNHCYIKTADDGIFTFKPYPSQADMTLEKGNDGWWTSGQTEEAPTVLETFDIAEKMIFVTPSDINVNNPPCITVNAKFTEDSGFEDIGLIPMEYSVTYKGENFNIPSTPLEGYNGYYEGDIKELNMNFMPIESSITISSFSSSLELGDIAEGIYEIEITAPTATGNVTCPLILVVRENIPEATERYDVTVEDGKADVIFTNVSEQPIDNAVMMLCAYDGTGLKALKRADKNITLGANETQVLHFDINGIDYNTFKLLVWDSEKALLPICDYYEKK